MGAVYTLDGFSLDLSGALVSQGYIPALLKPLWMRLVLSKQFSTAVWSTPMTEYLFKTWPVLAGLVCHIQASFFNSFFRDEKKDKSSG